MKELQNNKHEAKKGKGTKINDDFNIYVIFDEAGIPSVGYIEIVNFFFF